MRGVRRARAALARAPRRDPLLLAAIARRDMAALGELYSRYAPSLFLFVRRVAIEVDAEDLVQAIFLRVLDIAGSYNMATISARPWLFGIAVQLLRERSTALKRFTRAVARAGAVPPADEPSSPASADARRDLARALAELSEAKRTVLILAEVEGFRCEEIAVMVDVPIGTVWTRLHHARKELRARIGREP